MRCCKQIITTPFCPQCGKQATSPLLSLLSHLEWNLKAQQGRLDSYRDRIARGDPGNRAQRGAKKQEATVHKWASWVQCIRSMVESADTKDAS